MFLHVNHQIYQLSNISAQGSSAWIISCFWCLSLTGKAVVVGSAAAGMSAGVTGAVVTVGGTMGWLLSSICDQNETH